MEFPSTVVSDFPAAASAAPGPLVSCDLTAKLASAVALYDSALEQLKAAAAFVVVTTHAGDWLAASSTPQLA